MRGEFAVVKQSIEGLKTSIGALSQTVQGMAEQMSGMAKESTVRKIAAEVAVLRGDVIEIKRDYATKDEVRGLRSEMHARFDQFMPDIEAARRDRLTASDHYMGLQDKLSDHERRISRLESRDD